jgi:integrase
MNDGCPIGRFFVSGTRHSPLVNRGLHADEGADLADVQALLGHENPKTTARYAQVSVDKLITAVQRMERGWNEARGDRSAHKRTVAGG